LQFDFEMVIEANLNAKSPTSTIDSLSDFILNGNKVRELRHPTVKNKKFSYEQAKKVN